MAAGTERRRAEGVERGGVERDAVNAILTSMRREGAPSGQPVFPVRRPGLASSGAGLLALVLVVGTLASACGNGGPTPSSAPTTKGQHTSVPPSGTATTSSPGSTLAPVSATGPLQAGAAITLPFSADRVAAAESPDGAVFAAPADPASTQPSVAWVVDGNGSAAVAEHVATGIAALAADSANFYVATDANVFAYDRTSGDPVGQWTLPSGIVADTANPDPVAMTAAGGALFVTLTRGTAVQVERIAPTSPSSPRVVARGLGAVVGPDGSVYYERADNHLAVVRPDGTQSLGPALANAPTALGGGVQYLEVVAGQAVWVSEPQGQGLDTHFTTYDAGTFATVGSFGGMATSMVASSVTGPLMLAQALGEPGCPQPAAATPAWCVFRVDVHGAMTDPVGVGAAVTLLGPGPAVIVSNGTTGQFDLVRLS